MMKNPKSMQTAEEETGCYKLMINVLRMGGDWSFNPN